MAVAHFKKKDADFAPGNSFWQRCKQVLRINIALVLTGDSYRDFSTRLADSYLLQYFCKLVRVDAIKAPSKSTIERFAKEWVCPEDLHSLVDNILAHTRTDSQCIGLAQELDFTDFYIDSTCVEAEIHYPVDWLLFLDAVRTLMKATLLIRKQGIKNRMAQSPKQFISRINKMGMAMTQQARRPDSKKNRKKIFRQIKTIMKTVEKHAQAHRNLLSRNWEHTDWSEKQAQQVIGRIDKVIEQLPEARKQAQQRIIQEQPVAREDKILSLYEPDAQLIVRGKSGKSVEFGNQLTLVEQADGLIVHWDFHKELTSDKEQLKPVHKALSQNYQVDALTADRGYDSKANQKHLKEKDCFNGIFAKSVEQAQAQQKDTSFVQRQKRRAQTEGRIGLFKRSFLGQGRRMRSKGFGNRDHRICWGILTHNLWVLARKLQNQEASLEQAA